MKSKTIIFIMLICFSSTVFLTAQAVVIEWNTFMGSEYSEKCHDITLDTAGNSYIIGWSTNSWGSPIQAHSGGDDVFVACLDSSGNRLWNTFMGSSQSEYGHGITLSSSGYIYVFGYGNATWGSPVNTHSGDHDVFIACLDSSGNRIWNTFLGSSTNDIAKAISLDNSGNIYITGYSEAPWGSPINAYSGGQDILVAGLDSSGNLLWNTFLGSTDTDNGLGITADNLGNIYVTGYSNLSWGLPVSAHSGSADAFIVCLDSSGNRLWNTFLGSSNGDFGRSIIVNGSGIVFVTGESNATWGSPLNPICGGFDVFVACLDNSGNLLRNTFLGSSELDTGSGIALDNSGNIYVAGRSDAGWGVPVNPYSGSTEVFVAGLNSSGQLIGHTFLGSPGGDYDGGIAMDGSRNIYVAGYSDTSWGLPVNTFNNGLEAFVAKLSINPVPDITANGSDGPLVITQLDTLKIHVSLNTLGLTDNADFWLAFKSSSGWHHYNHATKTWDPGLGTTFEGGLFDLNNKKVFQSSGLSSGKYTFYFGIDMDMNGTITKSSLYYDEVQVTVVLVVDDE